MDRHETAPDPARICVIVAAYNEAPVVADTLAGLLGQGYRVVVVDDGSSDDTALRAAATEAEVLRHPVNLGQGAALQTGLDWALERGSADWIATFDADGQHDAADLPRMAAALTTAGADIALGSRFLGTASGLPPLRRTLLKGAVLMTWLTTGVRLTDAHNGLRVMTPAAARRLRITHNGMAHASEIVDQIHRLGLKHVEVPVHIRYTEYSLTKGQKLSGGLNVLSELISSWIQRW